MDPDRLTLWAGLFDESDGEMDLAGFLKRGFALGLVPLLAATACNGIVAPPEASVAVDPTSGAAGTEVIVTGEGFPANIEINIRLGPPEMGASPEAYANTMTTENGAFVTAFAIPNKWPDETPIVEEELLIIALIPDGSVKATASFDYQPTLGLAPEIALTPPNGKPGQRVVVRGVNFPREMAISLRLSSPASAHAMEEVAQIVSDKEGRFRTVIIIPDTWSGSTGSVLEQELVVEAVGAKDGQSLARATFFNVSGKPLEG